MVTQTIRLVEKVDRRPEMRERIRADFVRLPGLKLTLEQATRLWGLERTTCHQLLESLVAAGFLAVGDDGRFHRVAADAPVAHDVPPRPRAKHVSPG
jgi:hypothetical protein